MLENSMEGFVKERIDKVLDMFPDCCRCEKCRQDILVLALNNLPPMYVNLDKGELYTRLNSYDSAHEAKIIQEIAKAVEIVSKHPRHD